MSLRVASKTFEHPGVEAKTGRQWRMIESCLSLSAEH